MSPSGSQSLYIVHNEPIPIAISPSRTATAPHPTPHAPRLTPHPPPIISGVRFKAVTGSGKSGDMAIDDVVISVSAYREAKCDDEDDDDDWDDYSYFHSYSYDYEDDGYECGKGETCYDDEKDEDDEYKDVDSFSFSYEYSYACACPEDFTDCGTYCDFDGDCSGDDWCDVNGADNGWSEMCRLEYYEACDYYSCGKASVCEYTDDWWMWSYR